MSEPKVYGSIADLVKAESACLVGPQKKRVYRVGENGTTKFVAAASPGQAALAVCPVELVGRSDLATVAFEALGGIRRLPFEEDAPAKSETVSHSAAD